MHKFTDKQLETIDQALSIAASVYDDDAKKMDETGQPRLAEQFRKQAREARALAMEIVV